MACCGSNRTVAFNRRHRLRVRYGGVRAVAFRGAATGIVYRFSGTAREQTVDPRDASLLLRLRVFKVVGVVETAAETAGKDR